jgi:lipoprotein
MKNQQAVKSFLFLAVLLCGTFSACGKAAAAGNAKSFFKPETAASSSKDGSIFPGGECTSCNPKDKDGSIFPGGSCVNCPTTKCVNCEPKKPAVRNYEVAYDDEIYKSVYRDCKNFAPITLEYVDFRIKKGRQYTPYSTKLGQYRFRIFGCRRFEKDAILNQGRIMQKDMKFIPIFNKMVGNCYPIRKMPSGLCLETSPSPLPEYILTAEITDYYMNLCDEYDWDKSAAEDKRTGSSEMTVTWRLMDITKTNVYWKGTSTGYGEVSDGEYNAEIRLVEDAFADAVSNLRNLPGFEKQLATRVHPDELAAERQALIEAERISDPVRCKFEPEIKKAEASEFSSLQEMTEQNVLPADENYSICAMTPGQLDEKGQPLPMCQMVPVTQEVLEIPADDTLQIAEVPGDVVLLETVDVVEAPVTEIVEDSGVISNGGITKMLPEIGTETLVMPPETGTIEEEAGVIIDGSGINETGGALSASEFEPEKPQIEESSGIIDSGSGSKDTVAVVDDSWIDIDSERREAAEQAFFASGNSLCIIDRNPYDKLTPENLYKVRASIVSVTNGNGKRGAGLIVSEQFVLISADLIVKDNNRYNLETINGGKLKATAFRINPSKNTALLVLDEKTKYTPLSLNLDLPDVGQNGFLALGLLDIDGSFENGEGYLDNAGTVSGYRYSDEKGAQIIIDTFVQTVTIGGALIDEHGTINGFAADGKKTDDSPDLFIPTETALRSLGLSICGKPFTDKSPWQKYKPLTEAILKNSGPKDPAVMDINERK